MDSNELDIVKKVIIHIVGWGAALLIVFLCLGYFKLQAPKIRARSETVVLHKLHKKFAADMKSLANLDCIHCNKIGPRSKEKIHFSFNSSERINQSSLNRARKIAIDTTERLLNLLNSEESLKTQALASRLTNENIQIDILFNTKSYEKPNSRLFDKVTIDETGITYLSGKKGNLPVYMRKEPYKLALKRERETKS